MGIPAFFRQIIEKYPKTHSPQLKTAIDYFFIDFNSIIYDTYYGLDRKINATTTQFEKYLIEEVLKRLSYIINEVVKPTKVLYIAMDGPAPRAKMVQQRWRRYKSGKDKEYLARLREKYEMEKETVIWDASANISPGTKFMKKLATVMKNQIKIGKLGQNTAKIILSDSNIPGEGEHKFLPFIRDLTIKEPDSNVVIYSPDADMIVLSMATHKNGISILRKVKTGDDATQTEKQYVLSGREFLYLSIDEYRRAFIDTLEITKKDAIPIRIITDYVFMTFLGGNDFVMPFPYLKIKEERKDQKTGLGLLLAIYGKLTAEFTDYLIIEKKIGEKIDYHINHTFLTRIFEELAKSEDYYMRGFQMRINRVMEGLGEEQKIEKEKGKLPFEIERARYEHFEYYSPLHPQYNQYKNVFRKIDYTKPKNEWKAEYYDHFFGINPKKNMQEYNQYRTAVSINYLETLVFTMRYYLMGLPSWTFYYQYRAPPIASDVYFNLQKTITDVNKVKFEMGKPYRPFDQLMMILPSSMGQLLPTSYKNLMNKELLDYYPIDFETDVYLGGKHIYSEPILPYIDDKRVLEETAKIYAKLTDEEKERNSLTDELFMITRNPNPEKKVRKIMKIKN